MKKHLLAIILAPALILGACDTNSTSGPEISDGTPVLQKSGDPTSFDGRFDSRDRRGIDLDALTYYRLIVAANPDLSERVKTALMELIRESMERRQRIMMSTDSRARLALLLQAEHEKLIAAMNSLLTREQIARALALKKRLDRRGTDRG